MTECTGPHHEDEGINRKSFLKRTVLAGAGIVVAVAGGKVATTALANAAHPHAAGATADFSFVQITDTHVGAHSPANKNVIATFEEAVRHINALPQRPAFVVHTGDHVHLSKESEFDTASQILGTIKADRIFNVPGEHDVFLDKGKRYLQYFGRGTRGGGYFSFDYKGVHFLGLADHAGVVGTGQGILGAEQLAFVKQDLAGLSSDTPLVLFSHVPLLPVYLPWGWATSDGPALLALVRRFHAVTALNGHIHQIISRTAGNMVMHTANSTAYPLHPPGQVAPAPLVLPAAELPRRIGIRAGAIAAGATVPSVMDEPLG
jgi:3',5'-cyclic AMP phosphodiesterase CpdA